MRTAAAVMAAVTVLTVAGGCGAREAICAGGEYPVAAVGSTTGRACVSDGQQPPAGYVRFPDGKVPQHVDDDWDKYWSTHALDAQGQEIAK